MNKVAAVLAALISWAVHQGYVEGRTLRNQLSEDGSYSWHSYLQPELGHINAGKFVPVASAASAHTEVDWIHGFSALRDPKREEVRIFFDSFTDRAEAVKSVFFASSIDLLDDKGLEGAIEVTDCLLQWISDPDASAQMYNPDLVKPEHRVKFIDGWQLTCPDPGPSFLSAVIVYDKSKYTRFTIDTIAQHRVGKVGACMAPLYTARLYTRPWLFYNARQGVEYFMMYRAKISNWTTKMTPHMIGIWPSGELSDQAPVKVFHRQGVYWFTYYPPPLRYMHGQSTALNDCIMRNRYLFDYVVVTDVDEMIRVPNKTFSDLGTFFDEHFPPLVSSLAIRRFVFPAQCCSQKLDELTANNEDESIRFVDSCQKHTVRDHGIGKSVYRPQLVDGIYQHGILYGRQGAERVKFLNSGIAHIVHLKLDPAWNLAMDCDYSHTGVDEIGSD